MKSLLITLVIALGSPAFANCVNDMMAGPANGNLDRAQELCRISEASGCNLSKIIEENHGLNYADAATLCERKLRSNADLIRCLSQGYTRSECTSRLRN